MDYGSQENGARTDSDQSETGGDSRVSFESQSFVYFIRAGRTNLVKIGLTRNVENRLAELQTASPHQLHLLGYMPGTLQDEQEWHLEYAADRIRGEWFTLTSRLREAINRLPYTNCCFVQFLHLSLLTRNAA